MKRVECGTVCSSDMTWTVLDTDRSRC